MTAGSPSCHPRACAISLVCRSKDEGGSRATPAARAAAARLGRQADQASDGAAWGPGACRAVEKSALLVAAPAGAPPLTSVRTMADACAKTPYVGLPGADSVR